MVSLENVDDQSPRVFSRPIVAWGKTHIDAAPFSPSRLSPAMADFYTVFCKYPLQINMA